MPYCNTDGAKVRERGGTEEATERGKEREGKRDKEAGEHNFVCTVMVKNGRTCCMQLRRLVYRLVERNSRRQAGSHA